MTDKQKAAFLKSEGWKGRRDSEFGDLIWVDPLGRWERMNTASAYAVAHRRKSQRERARLKRAGFRKAGDFWVAPKTHIGYLSRAEALSALEGGGEPG